MSDDAIEVTEQESASIWEDLVDVFASPFELFRRRQGDTFVRPFWIFVAIMVALYYGFLLIGADIPMGASMNAGADTAEASEGARTIGRWVGGIAMIFGYGFGILMAGVALRIATWMFEPSASWRQAFLIAAYATYVQIPQQLIAGTLSAVTGETGVKSGSFGVLRFMDIEALNPVLTVLLAAVDVFALWGLLLTAIGLMVVVKMERPRAIFSAVFALLIMMVPAVVAMSIAGRMGMLPE